MDPDKLDIQLLHTELNNHCKQGFKKCRKQTVCHIRISIFQKKMTKKRVTDFQEACLAKSKENNDKFMLYPCHQKNYFIM